MTALRRVRNLGSRASKPRALRLTGVHFVPTPWASPYAHGLLRAETEPECSGICGFKWRSQKSQGSWKR